MLRKSYHAHLLNQAAVFSLTTGFAGFQPTPSQMWFPEVELIASVRGVTSSPSHSFLMAFQNLCSWWFAISSAVWALSVWVVARALPQESRTLSLVSLDGTAPH